MAVQIKRLSQHNPVNYWPGLLDMVTSALMVFVLITYFQINFNVDALEALRIRDKQGEFIKALDNKFSVEQTKGQLSVEQKINYIRLTFSDQVLFGTNGYEEFSIEGYGLLRKLGRFLKAEESTKFVKIQIEGHTDSKPYKTKPPNYPFNNWELSSARGTTVMQMIKEDSGLCPAYFSINGNGEFYPVSTENTDEARTLNRRIEVLVFWQSTQEERQCPTGKLTCINNRLVCIGGAAK
jgi:flagellar motor protein MotB